MATIRVHCPHCPTSVLVRPEQLLLVPHGGGGIYLYACPTCGQVTDGPASPEQVLLLEAAGVSMPAPPRISGR